ncbi:MAG: hypothetical protein IKM46_08790 [Clostridia bacterium]|nr:hypothetical protein [Clostridia bacterium]
MLKYIKDNSKIITKLLLNQTGATILGFTISGFGVTRDSIFVFTSLFAIAFYISLIYSAMWEEGGKERIRIDGGRAEMKPLRGLWVSLIANIPNMILALCIVVGTIFGHENGPFSWTWAGSLNGICKAIAVFWEGMYTGLIRTYSPYNPIAYVLVIFPAVFVSTGAYYLGVNNKKLLGFLRKEK